MARSITGGLACVAAVTTIAVAHSVLRAWRSPEAEIDGAAAASS